MWYQKYKLYTYNLAIVASLHHYRQIIANENKTKLQCTNVYTIQTVR